MSLSAKEAYAIRLGNSSLIEVINEHSKESLTDIAPDSLPVPQERMLNRARFAFNHYLRPGLDHFYRWLKESNEASNFTYDITELNKQQLAGFVNTISGVSLAQALFYIRELTDNKALRDHVNEHTLNSPFAPYSDMNQGYGRRLGWYALIRAKKPKLVIETGVDKGLGSCVITAALIANHEEGFSGTYLGTDINPAAGFLFQGPYAEFGRILYGDSLESLANINQPVDVFINDSDHSTDYELREYELIHHKLAPKAVILGDNSHCSDSLFVYATGHNKKFTFFSEKPEKHWYPGAGIGASW